MKSKYKQVIWKLRSVKTQTQGQELITQVNVLIALKLSLGGEEIRHPIHQNWEEEKYFIHERHKLAVDVTFV